MEIDHFIQGEKGKNKKKTVVRIKSWETPLFQERKPN